MKHLKNIAYTFCLMAIGVLSMNSCGDDNELYEVNKPEWVSDRINEISNGSYDDEPLPDNMMDDIYTVGATDYSTLFDTKFSKYYQIAKGQKWVAQFELNIDPSPTTEFWKNVALELSNDVTKGEAGYYWYGTMRYDNVSGAQWGAIDEQYTSTTLQLRPVNNVDVNVQKLGGTVTLTIDRTREDSLIIKLSNGPVKKIYAQPYTWQNQNADMSNTNIRCRLVVDHSYINFLSTNVEAVKIPVVESLRVTKAPTRTSYSIYVSEALGDGYPFDPTGMEVEAVYSDGTTKPISLSALSFSKVPYATGKQPITITSDEASTTYEVDVTASPVTDVKLTPTILGAEDNSTGFFGAMSEFCKVEAGKTVHVRFTNYSDCAAWYHHFLLQFCSGTGAEYGVARADNFCWKVFPTPIPGCVYAFENGRVWESWNQAMNGAKVDAYITNTGDGNTDAQFVMKGSDGQTYTQYYLYVTTDVNDNYFRFTIENAHLVFE